jgi:hypothetical protein
MIEFLVFCVSFPQPKFLISAQPFCFTSTLVTLRTNGSLSIEQKEVNLEHLFCAMSIRKVLVSGLQSVVFPQPKYNLFIQLRLVQSQSSIIEQKELALEHSSCKPLRLLVDLSF